MVSEFNGLNRYHATAVESGDHLSRCMVYIDTNIVRAGVVSHPSMWRFSGYSEIQEPRRKNILIDYERLQGLFGAGTHAELKTSHRGWIEEYLGDAKKGRQVSGRIASPLGARHILRRRNSYWASRQKGEKSSPHTTLLDTEKGDIGPENTYSWDINTE